MQIYFSPPFNLHINPIDLSINKFSVLLSSFSLVGSNGIFVSICRRDQPSMLTVVNVTLELGTKAQWGVGL